MNKRRAHASSMPLLRSPGDVHHAARMVESRTESCSLPRDYFRLMARRLHADLAHAVDATREPSKSVSWLDGVRLLYSTARDEQELLATWIYARFHEGRGDESVLHRDEVVATIAPECRATPAVAQTIDVIDRLVDFGDQLAAWTNAPGVRNEPPRCQLPAASDIAGLVKAIGGVELKSCPRWLAFAHTTVGPESVLPYFDSLIEVRRLLGASWAADWEQHLVRRAERLAKSPSGEECFRNRAEREQARSMDLKRALAATWLRREFPKHDAEAIANLARFSEAIALHDQRTALEELDPGWRPALAAVSSQRDQIRAACTPIVEWAQFGIRAAAADQSASREPVERRRALERERAFITLLGQVAGGPCSDAEVGAGMAELVLGLEFQARRNLDSVLRAWNHEQDAQRAAGRYGWKPFVQYDHELDDPKLRFEQNLHGMREAFEIRRIVRLVGTALRARELTVDPSRADAPGAAHSQHWKSSQALTTTHALSILRWLNQELPVQAQHKPFRQSDYTQRPTREARRAQLLNAAQTSSSSREPSTLPAHTCLLRGLFALTGGPSTGFAAIGRIITEGVEAAAPMIATLEPKEFRLIEAARIIDIDRRTLLTLFLLRNHAQEAITLLPEFADEATATTAWRGIWESMNRVRTQLLAPGVLRREFHLRAEELERMPNPARRAYLAVHLQLFGDEHARKAGAGAKPAAIKSAACATGRRPPGTQPAPIACGTTPDVAPTPHLLRSAIDELGLAVVLQHASLKLVASVTDASEHPALFASRLNTPEQLHSILSDRGPRASEIWMAALHARSVAEGSLTASSTNAANAANATKATKATSSAALPTGSPVIASDVRVAMLQLIRAGEVTVSTLAKHDWAEEPVTKPARRRGAKGRGKDASDDERRTQLACRGFTSMLLKDDEIANRLFERASSAADLAFLAGADADAVVRRLGDTQAAQLVEFVEFVKSASKPAARASRPVAADTTATPDDERSRAIQAAAMKAVHDHIPQLAQLIGGAPTSPTATTLDPKRRVESVRRLLGIVAASRGKALVDLRTLRDLALALKRSEGGKQAAGLLESAVRGRKQPTRKIDRKKDGAIAAVIELADKGLRDEFDQLVDILYAGDTVADDLADDLTDGLAGRYTTHRIQKKRGGIREINEPDPDLKRLQRKVLSRLLSRVAISPQAQGFVRGRGILSNALAHTRARVVLNVDIRNFFTSLPEAEVAKAIGQCCRGTLSAEAVALLVRVVTLRKCLPQGAPTSPTITNIALRHADGILAKAARRIGVAYTRYADDLTFSGPDGPVQGMVPLVREVIGRLGLELHPDKTQVYRSGRRQLVTGLVVNERPNLPRRDRKRLRAAAHRRAQGLLMRWNGAEMSDAEFTGRLAYLATVSKPESMRLRIRSGLAPADPDATGDPTSRRARPRTHRRGNA